MSTNAWNADVKPSMPEPPSTPVLVDLGGTGFGFTAHGICHMVTDADLDEFLTPAAST